MKAGIVSLVAVLAVGAWWWLSRPDEVSEGKTGPPEKATAQGVETTPQITLMPMAAELARLNSKETEIGEDIEILDSAFVFYRRLYEKNPVGLNHEIVRALSGRNPKRAAFLAPDHPAINERGELCDRWGTPFFFHQLSGAEMEVISAGPDRQLLTGDDVKSG